MPCAPSLNDDFLVGIELDRIATLGMHDAKEAIFPAAEGKIRHRCGYADVNADVPGRGLVTKFSRCRSAGGKERSLVAERAARQKLECLVNSVGMDQAEHRPEDFSVSQGTVRGKPIQQCGANKVSGLVLGD